MRVVNGKAGKIITVKIEKAGMLYWKASRSDNAAASTFGLGDTETQAMADLFRIEQSARPHSEKINRSK